MRILIVEDDLNKARQISELIGAAAQGSIVTEHHSYQSGLRAAVTAVPDLILLDMTMPTYDVSPTDRGGRTRPYAGREILAELKRRNLPCQVIVVTQFESFGEGSNSMTLDQLRAQLKSEFPYNYLSAIFYHPAESSWREKLAAAVHRVASSRK